MTPVEEIRALADRAMADAQSERQAANDALIRASCYEDKAHELIALADRAERDAKKIIPPLPSDDDILVLGGDFSACFMRNDFPYDDFTARWMFDKFWSVSLNSPSATKPASTVRRAFASGAIFGDPLDPSNPVID
ncbi:hypothetical protein [Sphingobium yanoikuyae]|uniref:Uncharacterized protein n=1 Tax=Sphingobium yanoikuyae TaxID=13690 RepID=A0A3G2UN13_SPHYA|nr:hypothetical protein [Sphingobium yanoikuyae]AYO76446.1 hypothetical protein EBF16_05495 [Sphingobium yanoikuyae]